MSATTIPLKLRPATCLPLLVSALLAGCSVGPDYVRPSVDVPAAYREAAGWKVAEPQDEQAARSAWWEFFADPLLNELVAQVAIGNQNIRAAEAQYRQAVALLDSASAARWPTLSSGVSNSRGVAASGTSTTAGSIRTTDRLNLSSAWEADLWGRLGRNVEANDSNAAASAADLAAARLSAQAALAASYLQLRINDAQQRLLTSTIAAFQRSWEITRNRYQAGVVSQADVAQAESQLHSTQAQATDLGIQRAQLEHAIAILLGQPPSAFSLPPQDSVPAVPALPASLPASLLERRPDVAAAERRVAAANAQIGVAQAAFFPSLSLSAGGGYQNNSFTNLVSAPNRFWSFGPALALTLFDGGARAALKDQASANHERTVATYRQTVLAALQEVEDQLVSLRILDLEKDSQQKASRAARQFEELTTNQYLAGTVSYLNVATAQAAALSAERASLDLRNRQLLASVALLKATGGGWQGLPAQDQFPR